MKDYGKKEYVVEITVIHLSFIYKDSLNKTYYYFLYIFIIIITIQMGAIRGLLRSLYYISI